MDEKEPLLYSGFPPVETLEDWFVWIFEKVFFIPHHVRYYREDWYLKK